MLLPFGNTKERPMTILNSRAELYTIEQQCQEVKSNFPIRNRFTPAMA